VTRPARRRDALVRALLHNGWILAGVFLLGWSAALAIAASYLETLFSTVGLAVAVRVAHRGEVAADQGSAAEVTRETVIAGLALAALGLAFAVGILLQQTLEAFVAARSQDLALVVGGALLTAAIDYAFVQRRLGAAPDAWVRRRVGRQQKAMFALMLLLLIVPWSLLFIGRSGMIVTLFALKALLDAWAAAQADDPSDAA
jgi:hypothetical protein